MRRHEDAGGRYRIRIPVEFAVPDRGRDVDRPVARPADVAGPPGLESLIGADLVAEIVLAAGATPDHVTELIVEALGGEVALLLRDPLVQPHMRRDDELGHAFLRPGFTPVLRLQRG